MRTWDPDRKYQEPTSWWDTLTPRGHLWFAVFVLFCFTLLMIAVGTIETWGL